MYPEKYFSLFPAFPREMKIFVAMSFAPEFQQRWETVILPSIESIEVDGQKLTAQRVDTRTIGDSILTEILGGISESILVFADITTLGQLDGRPIRNGNVMYEVGLAHAVRLPEEVLVFRSDTDNLLFDITNVRINSYNPDEFPHDARKVLADAFVNSLREVELKKHLAVRSAARIVDFNAFVILAESIFKGFVVPFGKVPLKEAFAVAAKNIALQRLLEIGAIETVFPDAGSNAFRLAVERGEHSIQYRPTSFGRAIHNHIAQEMTKNLNAEQREELRELLSKNGEES